jgi:ATP-dependent RNA helicase DDX18/HAS1
MAPTELAASSKRKRSHKSKKPDAAAANAPVETPRKKAKKQDEPAEEVIAEPTQAESEEEQEVAAKPTNDDTAENENEQESEEDAGDLTTGTAMPTIMNPTRFDELKLSDRTMEAITAMGFETMTEIQQKSIPALLSGKVSCGLASCMCNLQLTHLRMCSVQQKPVAAKLW